MLLTNLTKSLHALRQNLWPMTVASHSVLIAQVEKDINASFEQKLSIEREKIDVVERMAKMATCELESLRAEREEDRISLIKERAAIESERVVFSRLRHETEDHLQNLMSDMVQIAHEKETIIKLRELAENEEKEIKRLQYELEVEWKALSMARAWAEDEAKRVSGYAMALERARDRWKRNEKAVDDEILEDSTGVTVLNPEEQLSVQDTVDWGENLVQKLKKMAADVGGRARDMIDEIILIISQFVSRLEEWASKSGKQTVAKADKSAHEVQQGAPLSLVLV